MLETEGVQNYGYSEAPGRNYYDFDSGNGLNAPLASNSVTKFTEHMESGAARLERTLELLNLRYQTLFFLAALAVVVNAVLTFLNCFGITELPVILLASFLIGNGLMVMVLDVPGTPRWAAKYRRHIRKNMRFLTRLTGKSLWLSILGAATFVTVRVSKTAGALRLLFGLLSTVFVFGVSFSGFLIAIRKSFRLEKAKSVIKDVSKGAYIDCYRKYALGDPDHGMQFEEFNRMCADHTSGKLQFDIVDLYIIFNVLDEHQKCAINEREFYEWIAGSIVFL